MWVRHKDATGNPRLTNLEDIASIRLGNVGTTGSVLAYQDHDQNAAPIPLLNNVTPEVAQQFFQRITMALSNNEHFLDLVV